MLAEISRRLPSAPPPPNLGFAREPALADPRDNVFQTRVGPRWIDPALVIDMPGGLAGFPALRSFAGIQLERARFGPLNLLQSLEDPRVAFLVFPMRRVPPSTFTRMSSRHAPTKASSRPPRRSS